MFEFYEKWVNVAAGIGENRWKENDTRERAFAPRGRSFFVLNTPNIDVHVHANMCARVCVWHISSSVKKRVVCRTIVLSSRRNCTSIMHYRTWNVGTLKKLAKIHKFYQTFCFTDAVTRAIKFTDWTCTCHFDGFLI